MTPEQMIEYARGVCAGAKIKHDEVRVFMRAIVDGYDQPEATVAAPDPDVQVSSPAEAPAPIGPCPVAIRRIPGGGIHLPVEANRSYTARDALALAHGIQAALEA